MFTEGTIKNSYTAVVVKGNENTGGIIGSTDDKHISQCNNIYYDTESTGQTSSAGGAGVSGKSALDMIQKSTYENWDFDTIWQIKSGEYPTLQWQK